MAIEEPSAPENPQDYSTTETKDLTLSQISSQDIEKVYPYHRDPGYRPWLRPAGPRKPTPYEEILAMMARHINYAVMASRCTFIFAVVIVLDFTLPKTPHAIEVIGYNTSPGGTIQMELNDGSVINISKKAMRKMKGQFLTISRTRIFSVPYRMTDQENNSAAIEISIYGNFIFWPLVLLLTSLVGVLYRRGVELRFNLGVASVVLALLNIAVLHVHEF